MYRKGARFGTDSPVSLDGVAFEMFNEPVRSEPHPWLIAYTWYNAAGKVHRGGDLPAKISYGKNPNGSFPLYSEWFKNGVRHRDGDSPAWVEYFNETNEDGSPKISRARWLKNGVYKREGGKPEDVEYFSFDNEDGSQKIRKETWVDENDYPHRDDGPAYILYSNETNEDGSHKILEQKWFKNGDQQRDDDLPAGIDYFDWASNEDGSQKIRAKLWYKNNLQHREGDLPAQIEYFNETNEDGSQVNWEIWYKDGKKHRDGSKPAILQKSKTGQVIEEEYFVNDRLHNLNGPALKRLNDDGHPYEEYYIDGTKYTKKEYDALRKQSKNSLSGALNRISASRVKRGKLNLPTDLIKDMMGYGFGKKESKEQLQ